MKRFEAKALSIPFVKHGLKTSDTQEGEHARAAPTYTVYRYKFRIWLVTTTILFAFRQRLKAVGFLSFKKVQVMTMLSAVNSV